MQGEFANDLEKHDPLAGLDAETLAEVAGEVAVAQAATHEFMQRHPELLPCLENSIAIVKHLLWIQEPPSVADLEALYAKLRAEKKLVLRGVENMEYSVFSDVARDLQEIGPIGSIGWYDSWLKLRNESQDWLEQQLGNGRLHPNSLADAMVLVSEQWFRDEFLSVMSGESLPRFKGNGFAPPMPVAMQKEWDEFLQSQENED
jgi:hypothetical protein